MKHTASKLMKFLCTTEIHTPWNWHVSVLIHQQYPVKLKCTAGHPESAQLQQQLPTSASRELREVQQEVFLSSRCKTHPGQYNNRFISLVRKHNNYRHWQISLGLCAHSTFLLTLCLFGGCAAGPDLLSSSQERSVLFHILSEAVSAVTLGQSPLTPAGAGLAQGRPRAGTSPFLGAQGRRHGAGGGKTTKHNKNS